MTAAAAIAPESMSREERIHAAYAAGRLRYKILQHRRETYDRFYAWNIDRRTPEHRARNVANGARFDKMWVDKAARRTAKTGSWLLVAEEECAKVVQREGRGASGMVAIPVQKKIGEVLVPNIKKIFKDAPKGYFPEYRSSGQGHHEHLYIPALEARIKLVGLDYHPDALRGPFLDFGFVTEAGFVDTDLEETVVSEILLQLQGLPNAWFVLESSAPKTLAHQFNRIFVSDARIRGAYSEQVITDNTTLTQEEIDDEIRMCGGMEAAKCQRELFNIVKADADELVLPEFDEAVHVVDPRDWIQPQHALCHVGLDPGRTDPFGLVWLYLDWMRQTVVIQAGWKRSNASLGDVVNQIKPMEARLWGTDHSTPTTRAANTKLIKIRDADVLPSGAIWEPPSGSCTYWDAASWTLRPNPFSRVSDVDNGCIIDLNRDYALQVRAAEKGPGSAEDDLQHLRMLFGARHPHNGMPKIVILRNGFTDGLIEECRSGMWKIRDEVHRHDWQRSKLLGHLDTFSALKYVVRDIKWARDPFPPAARDLNAPNTHVPPAIADKMRGFRQMPRPQALGGYRTQWRPR